ncbi:MAG: 3-deoxy-7-phosphoheptulonate synthase [Chloroflexota bacterium]|nr:3-deoxy-7-phosphoheptulonate synthase [Chloroflexota bacterium]
MIIMKAGATDAEVANVVEEIKKYGLRADVSRGEFRTVIGLVGDERKIPFSHFAVLPGVKEAMMVETPYKLISKEYSKLLGEEDEPRVIKVGNISIGGDEPVFIAGPCAVESRQQLFRIAEGVKKAGAHILRGGVFKPRSSVHSFQGLGAGGPEEAEEALSWLREAGQQFEMPVITEIRGETQVDLVADYVDILQIGARNMYDQDLLTRAARKNKPVMLKRHFGAGIEEFLSFAEYIAAEGNKDIILCERGIIPIGKGKSYTRYTLDLAAVPAIQKETYLPILADPSHATGRRDLIFNMSCASIAAGASGLMIETHYNPAEAMVDGQQMITPDELKEVIQACQSIHRLLVKKQK